MGSTRDGLGKQCPVVLYQRDKDVIEQLKEFGLGNRSAAVRFALRLVGLAMDEGLKHYIVELITFVLPEEITFVPPEEDE